MLVEPIRENYQMMAAYGHLLLTGGEGFKSNPKLAWRMFTDAAEMAMACMRGKLSQSYYELALVAEAVMPDSDVSEADEEEHEC